MFCNFSKQTKPTVMTRSSSLIVLYLCIHTSIIAQNCDGILDTIQVCNFEYDLDLLSSDGILAVTCPDVEAHIVMNKEDSTLNTTVNKCGEYIITHSYVFDRWGELLYQSSNPEEGWDGLRKNRALKPSVFIYQLNAKVLDCKGEVVDIKKYGDFTLVK